MSVANVLGVIAERWFSKARMRGVVGAMAGLVGLFVAPAANAQTIAELYVMQDSRFFEVNPTNSNDYTPLGSAQWGSVTAFADGNGVFWATQDGLLYLIDRDGVRQSLGSGWGGAVELTLGYEASGTPKLYAVQDSKLWKVVPGTGHASRVGTEGWANSTSMAYLDADLAGSNKDLYVVQAGSLWRADKLTGVSTRLGTEGAWTGETLMTAFGGSLYIVQNSRLHRVDPTTGAFTPLGNPVWGGATSMTGMFSSLYIIQNDRIHAVNPTTGAYSALGDPLWGGPTFIGHYSVIIH